MNAKITYNSVTLTISRGPINFTPYWSARVHDNLSTSGAVRERVVEHLDILIEMDLPHMIIADDIEAWALFEAWALAGNPFCFFPCTSLSDYYNCVLEDITWKAVRNAPRKYGLKIVVRILNDGQAPASPVIVLRRFHGIAN